MLPKLIASFAAVAPLLACLPADAQPGGTQLAMLDPFMPRSPHADTSLVRVKGNAPDPASWPIIHGPSYLPMWSGEGVPRDGKRDPLESDRFHFH